MMGIPVIIKKVLLKNVFTQEKITINMKLLRA